MSPPPEKFLISILLALAIFTLFILKAWIPFGIFHLTTEDNRAIDDIVQTSNFTREELKALDEVLHKATMGNNTVILTTVNEAWASNKEGSMLDFFLERFSKGNGTEKLLPHLVMLAFDQTSYNRCMEVHIHCYLLQTKEIDFSGNEKAFMSDLYLKMMWRRTYFMGIIFKLGYSFVFTDTDIVWFQDPFVHFHQDADLEIACDHYTGNEDDMGNSVNGGFLRAVSNNRTIQFYDLWYESHNTIEGHDQHVFNMIKQAGTEKFGLKLKFLDTRYFSGFCEVGKSIPEVCTLHANCCGLGFARKMEALKLAVEDWTNYFAKPTNQSWTKPSCYT